MSTLPSMKNYIWCEKYRPQTINDCILPKDLKDILSRIVASGEIPNMMFFGPAGCGKTTAARAMCREMDADVLFINASEESGIDTLRTKVRNFASTVSMTDQKKVVILDEADYLNPQSTQPALRGFIEEFADNCRFIFTCNFLNKIIKPLHSRCSLVNFQIANDEKVQTAYAFMQRICGILNAERIEYDKNAVAGIINKHFPDFRRVINELQKYSHLGRIDVDVLTSVGDVNIAELFGYMKDKNFGKCRVWVVENIDNDPAQLFRKIYDNAGKYVKDAFLPELILILADYQYKSSFVADQEINFVAFITMLMAEGSFK